MSKMEMLALIGKFSAATLIVISTSTYATNCALTVNDEEAVKCLERKIDKLEKKLKLANKSNYQLPRGAIIQFDAKHCPNNWQRVETKNDIVKLNSTAYITCKKLK